MAITLDGTTGITTPDSISHNGDTNTAIRFPAADTVTVETGGAERLRVDSSGNLIVGKTAINTTVVGGEIRSSGLGAFVRDGGEPLFLNRLTSDGNIAVFRKDGTTVGNIGAASGGIYFGSGPSGTERFRIGSSGNMLVGASSTFDNVSFLRVQVLGGVATKIDSTLSNSQVSFFNPNGRVGFIATSGTATSYNTSSDYRLKENVVPLIGAASRIAQIPVHQFNFIADPDTTVDGFLAHEVQAVIPEAVHGTKDEVDADGKPVYQGIDQSKIVPLLTAALQEALADIATLKAEVAALKGASV